MANRRQFIGSSFAVAALGALPAGWSSVLQAQELLPRRPIPGTGDSLPVIGLGNSSAFSKSDVAATMTLIDLFQARGGSYIDCRETSRFVVANAARSLDVADKIFLGTYFAEQDEQAMLADIKRLIVITGREKLDLAHSYVEYAHPNWSMFQDWKARDLTRYIGIARHNERYYERMIEMMQTGTIDFLQVNYSLLETQAEKRVLPMALEKGVAVTINRPFINGDFFARVRGHELPPWASEFDCSSWAQFSLKFILAHPAVTCVLTETANPKHALDNIGAGFGRLPDEKTRQRMVQYVKNL